MNALQRRELLRQAVFLLGGAALWPVSGAYAAGMGVAAGAPWLSPDRRALLQQVADAMIPATDTPGALDAGVPAWVEGMLAQWASTQTQAQIVAVLDAIDAHARAQAGAPWQQLSVTQRLDVLRQFDAAAVTAMDPGYAVFKRLLLTGYYLSEPGATRELRYVAVPGAWHADLPLTDVGAAWAI